MAQKNNNGTPFSINKIVTCMRNILILGGTGAMGAHLVEILASQGDKVSITTRSLRDATSKIEYIQGNAQDKIFLNRLLAKKWDAIVDFMVYSTNAFDQCAQKLLSATDQYIFLSSARVYADVGEKIREDSPRLLDSTTDEAFLATDEYSLAKARQENILRQSGNSNWTIIRPYITYSEQRLQLGILEKEDWLYRALKGRAIVFSEDIAAKLTTMTYGLDVAGAIAELIGNRQALGEAYHITQKSAATWREILEIYLNVLERSLSKRPKVILLGLDDFARCKRADYQIKYDRLFSREFDSSKISGILDLDSFLTIEQGLVDCLEVFLKNPQFLAIDWSEEAIKDRYSGEIAGFMEVIGWRNKVKYIIFRFIKFKR